MADKATSQMKEDVLRKKLLDIIVPWQMKIGFIKGQIDALEKLADFPIVAISAFLLKTQLVEFEIKQLITEIDLYLGFSSNTKIIRRKILKPKDMDRWTLGRLKDHLMKYDSKALVSLQQDLKRLNYLRNEFTHKLFSSSKGVKSLIMDSKKALPLVNKVLEEIEKVRKVLEINDPLTAITKKQ